MIRLVWRWRQAPGSAALIVMMAAMAVWSLFYALHLSPFIRPFENFWARLMFLGVVCIPPTFLVWASRFSQRDQWINRLTLALLVIEPVLLNLSVWTDSMHGWFTGGHPTGRGTPFIGGIAFWLHCVYSYVLMFIGGIFLFLNWLRAEQAYRKPAFWAMLGLPISIFWNFATVLRLFPGAYLDYSPIGFILTGAIFTYAQKRYRIFEILPVARTNVVEGMRDGVVVLDNQSRIIDMNPAAQSMLGLKLNAVLGMTAQTILPFWTKSAEASEEQEDIHNEFSLELYGIRKIDLNVTVIKDQHQKTVGKLVVMRDITKIKQIEAALRESNENLRKKLEEIESLQAQLKEQAIRDPLTGLYNRRFLEETLQRELAQTERIGAHLSIAMIDLDHFKNINDTHGHAIGDRLLSALGRLLSDNTRFGDAACRFGGEEFIVVMPGAPLETAAKRVDEWREAFSSLKITTGIESFSATFSAGLAGYPMHGKDYQTLINTADRALYAAKSAGRNRTVAAPVAGEAGGRSTPPPEAKIDISAAAAVTGKEK